MKNFKFIKISLLLCCFMSFFSANSQAVINDDKLIQLDENSSLNYSNAVVINSDLKSGHESFKVLKSIYNTPLSTLTYDSKMNQYYLQLELRAKPTWTKEEWNEFLKGLIN